MKKRYLTHALQSLFFILSFLSLAAQKNFVDGYVVVKSGDTIYGKINDRNWEVNPLKIQFQSGPDITSYSANDLRSFAVTGKDVYVSKIVTKDMRPVDVAKLVTYDVVDSLVSDTVFLRQLVKGPRLILFLLTDTKEHFYLQSALQETVRELSYKKYVEENEHSFYEQTFYRNQLAAFIEPGADAITLQQEIQNAKYDEYSLRRIVRELNGEKGREQKANTGQKKGQLVFMAGVGASLMNFKFTGDMKQWTGLHFASSAGQSAAIAAQFSGNRNLQKLALRIGVAYTHQAYNGTEYVNDYFGKPTRNSYRFTQNSVVPELNVLYHFYRTSRFRAYAGVGVAYHLSSYPENTFTSTTLSTGTQSTENNPLNFEKVWLTPNFIIGARCWNKLNINLAYIAAGGFVNYSLVHSSMFPLGLTVSYVFSAR